MKRLLRNALWICLTLGWSYASGQQPLVTAVGPIGITVSDMDRSMDFYSRVLHFSKISDDELAGENVEHVKGVFGSRIRLVRLQLGEEQIELSEFLAPQGRPVPIDSRSNDHWFQHIAIIVRDMDAAYAWLRQNKTRFASSGPQTLPAWNKNAGGIKAFYFRDPDNHVLEILWFPPGKGLPKWHNPGKELFMGLDHTAIVVSNTEASLRFYRDLLGMHVAGASENYGTEQEHLNNVLGAHLRITSLRASSGPGIEFLEYLAPRDGRQIPEDLRANDVTHWETELLTQQPVQNWGELLAKAEHISSQPEELSIAGEAVREFIIKDPDGHAVALKFAKEQQAVVSKQ